MAILFQSNIPAKTPTVLYTNNTTAEQNVTLYITTVSPNYVPTSFTTTPTQQNQMYTQAYLDSLNIHWFSTVSLALLPSGQTEPNSDLSQYILYESQIPHTLNNLQISLGVGESIWMYAYLQYTSVTITD